MTSILSFHFGKFLKDAGDQTLEKATNHGCIFANTSRRHIPPEYGTCTSITTNEEQTTYVWIPPFDMTTDVLVVAGGGGGGAHVGGGGGAGGYKEEQVTITAGTPITINVGAGGLGMYNPGDTSAYNGSLNNNGSGSSFGTITCTGGGRGGCWTQQPPNSGGSGGGGGHSTPGSGTAGQGYSGGTGRASSANGYPTGGGGGAGGPGGDWTDSRSGYGGPGKKSKITHQYYAGGGGGGFHGSTPFTSHVKSGIGGIGGGGHGNGTSTVKAGNGAPHTGGGGGGSGHSGGTRSEGGNGGSGIVVIRLKYKSQSPITIPGLVGWYNTASAELTNGNLTKWNDISGKENHVESASIVGNVNRSSKETGGVVQTHSPGSQTIVFKSMKETRTDYGGYNTSVGTVDKTLAAKKGILYYNSSYGDLPSHFGSVSSDELQNVTYTWTPPCECIADILVVGGGGGGGGIIGGGGGGGQVIITRRRLTPTPITIKVSRGGQGGKGWNTAGQDGYKGGDSQFDDLIAIGGGGGARHGNTILSTLDGGSGGGGANIEKTGGAETLKTLQTSKYTYGNRGGLGNGNYGGGGGGAGKEGGDLNYDNQLKGGQGGQGKYVPFASNFGDDGWFGGGGSGGVRDGGGRGVVNPLDGGGGTGTITTTLAGFGMDATGGGGGGAGYNGSSSSVLGGRGGSGVVIVTFYPVDGKGLTEHSFLYGDTSANLTFPTSVMNENTDYSLFHVARYNGSNKKRIFNGVGSNWLSGFWEGKSGVAFHEKWMTNQENTHGSKWVVSHDSRDLYKSNGITRIIPRLPGTTIKSTQLSINTGTDVSDWAVAEVIVYNRQLTLTERMAVESYLLKKYMQPGETSLSSGVLTGSILNSTIHDKSIQYPVSLSALATQELGTTVNTQVSGSDFRVINDSGALDSVSTSIRPVAAYGFRRLFNSYTGPQVRIERSDGIQIDLYLDASGSLERSTNHYFQNFFQWIDPDNYTNFVIWYDQSGNGNHMYRSTMSETTGVPKIKKSGNQLYVDLPNEGWKVPEYATPNINTDDYTFIMGLKTNSSNSTWRTGPRGKNSHHYLIIQDDGTEIGFYDNSGTGFNSSGLTVNNNIKCVISSIAGGGTTKFRLDGTGGTLINHQLPDFFKQPMLIGVSNQGLGELYEYIVYEGAQSDSFVQSVEQLVDDVL
jgi:hypothetical protein